MGTMTYDVIVVGAGHAGCEAALASARMGQKTLLVTIKTDLLAMMPCNPSIGGPAKGIVVREIDALGGEMGRNIDKSYIQMRMLNTGKGPAVRALRAQADRIKYAEEMRKTVDMQENLTLHEDRIDSLIVEDGTVKGVEGLSGEKYLAKSVVLTTGTSSRGEIIIGKNRKSSGPNGSSPSIKLSEDLLERGFELDRFKTGTPPRVHKDTINYEDAVEQPGDKDPHHFSFTTPDSVYLEDQWSCWLTHTTAETHKIVEENYENSAMYSGISEITGARYCPSIEDKIVRFSDQPRHQIFIEPEGLNNHEMYLQGLATSMPEDVQDAMLKSIPALRNAKITRSGYAIEYDVVLPYQLKLNLETKAIKNLFTAGQMNGTSGYEEAAGQGVYAGINAALRAQDKEPLILRRDQAYIGVMIDDLVTKGTVEPYRLLTSRAEYRLLLRHDNADFRLSEIGHDIGLLSEERYADYKSKEAEFARELKRFEETRLSPTPELNKVVEEKGAKALKDGILMIDLLKRPEWSYAEIVEFSPAPEEISREVAEQIEIRTRYQGYIAKEERNSEKFKKMEDKEIPMDFDYRNIHNLAGEARERFELIRPTTIGQASRISGITPSDVTFLTMYLEYGK